MKKYYCGHSKKIACFFIVEIVLLAMELIPQLHISVEKCYRNNLGRNHIKELPFSQIYF